MDHAAAQKSLERTTRALNDVVAPSEFDVSLSTIPNSAIKKSLEFNLIDSEGKGFIIVECDIIKLSC